MERDLLPRSVKMLDRLISRYMSQPVFTISADADLDTARDRLANHGVSSLAVSDAHNPVAAVISRTDLLAAGSVEVDQKHGALHLRLPPKKVREIANPDVVVVDPEVETVRGAAARMVDRRVHRVFAAKGEHLYGVLSTRDVMRCVADARVTTSIDAVMTTPVHVVEVKEQIQQAVARLQQVGTSAIVVVDPRDWPVGLLTQHEALEARGYFSADTVDLVMSSRFITVHANAALHHVAAQAVATRARHAVVVNDRQVLGVVSGLDFARAAAEWVPEHPRP
jgi:predicted transcriptional regulator